MRKALEAGSGFGRLSERMDISDLGKNWVNERESFKKRLHVQSLGNINTKYERLVVYIVVYSTVYICIYTTIYVYIVVYTTI